MKYRDIGKGVCRYEDPLKQGLFVYDPETWKIRHAPYDVGVKIVRPHGCCMMRT